MLYEASCTVTNKIVKYKRLDSDGCSYLRHLTSNPQIPVAEKLQPLTCANHSITIQMVKYENGAMCQKAEGSVAKSCSLSSHPSLLLNGSS